MRYKYFADKYPELEKGMDIGTGHVQASSIMFGTKSFMYAADCMFCDPPCSKGNLKSFYTKDGRESSPDFDNFNNALCQTIERICPNTLFLETFDSNDSYWWSILNAEFKCHARIPSMYYNKPQNRCYIQAHWNDLPVEVERGFYAQAFKDEEKVIEWICKEVPFECIADPCMGRGLVGWYANAAGRRFVGTELSKERLSVLCERITQGKRNV